VHTISKHFNENVADDVLRNVKNIKVVNAMSVIPHTSDLHSFMRGIKKLLKNESVVFIVRFPYLPSLIDNLEYDTIYHEHKRYFSLATFKTLLEMYGIYILDAKKTDVYGGSILIFSSSKKSEPSKRAKSILKEEERFSRFSTYAEFAENVKRMKYELIKILTEAKLNGKKIIGLGAPMKSATLLNYCGITPDILDYLTEVNQLKIGLLSPGVCIPVVDERRLADIDADYALMLSWNIADDLMKIWKKKAPKMKYIIPIPKPVILE
jgi:C-methyltransferase C-terminal domain